jgi:hypothetical protein
MSAAGLRVPARSPGLGASSLDRDHSLGAQAGDAAAHEAIDQSRAAEHPQLELGYLDAAEAGHVGVVALLGLDDPACHQAHLPFLMNG